jgi:hypothetical protein
MSEVKNNKVDDNLRSVTEVLDAIKSIQDNNVYSVFIPSLQKSLLFKEMTTKQEKMIVKTIVDSPVYNSEFIFAIREIIKENCAEDLDVDSLTIIDKTAICLAMREKSIGEVFTYTFKDTEKTKDIVIKDYIDKFKSIKIPEDKEVGTDDVRIMCTYPTILTEFKLESEFRSNVDDLGINSVAEARTAIGNVFTNEIVKYIKSITINKNGAFVSLDMANFNFKDRIVILEEIGNTAIREVVKYIEDANKIIKEKLIVEMELEDKEARELGTKKLSGALEVGSSFFIIS